MPRVRLLAAVALALVPLTSPPASATDLYAGFTCGLQAVGLPEPVPAGPGPVVRNGTLTLGPWVVTNLAPKFIDYIRINCKVQINDSMPGGAGVSRSFLFASNGGTVVLPVFYSAEPDDEVYVCTSVEWKSNKGVTKWPTGSGGVCALASSTGGVDVVVQQPAVFLG